MKIIFTLLIAMGAMPGFAQTGIHGLILSNDSLPSTGARVLLLDREDDSHIIGTVCDEKGRYQLEVIPGNYNLCAWSGDFTLSNCRNLYVTKAGEFSDAGILLLNEEFVEESAPTEIDLSSR
jgi:hypothetical protein